MIDLLRLENSLEENSQPFADPHGEGVRGFSNVQSSYHANNHFPFLLLVFHTSKKKSRNKKGSDRSNLLWEP